MAASLLFIDAANRDSVQQVHAHVVLVSNDSATGDDHAVQLVASPLTWHAVVGACLRALELDGAEHWREPTAACDLPALRGRVLVVEDHQVSQRLIARQLALLGLACDVVDSGHDALEMLADGEYALLLTDCNMPRMSGYELATAWRAREEGTGRRLPIVAMTANALSGDVRRARDAGMDDVLSKPLQLAELSRTLGEWLGQLDAPATDASHAALHALVVQETERDLRDLGQHLARQDLSATAQTFHRLMGTLALLGDDGLTRDGEQLHEVLHHRPGPDTLPRVAEFAQRLAHRLGNLGRP